MISKKISVVILFIACSIPLLAGGSNYSIYGIGDINGISGAVYGGLAGTSVAFPSESGINTRNPALFGLAKSTRLQIGYKFTQYMVDQGNESTQQDNSGVDAILGIFSVDTTLGIGISFGILPYANVNYSSASPTIVSQDGLELQGKSTYTGSGGISQAYLGGAFRVIGGLYAGASVYANFGVIYRNVKTELFDTYGFESNEENDDYFKGAGFKAGLYYEIGDFGFGAYYDDQFNMSLDHKVTYISLFTPDTAFSQNCSLDIPGVFGIGASYLLGRYRFGMDFITQDFSKFTYGLGTHTKFKSQNIISLGVSRAGSKLTGSSLPDRITYNMGLGYKQLYYSMFGTNINDIYGSFGMEIPVSNETKLDFSFTLGTRGTTSNNLIRETYGRIIFNISIGETWFKPFTRSYD